MGVARAAEARAAEWEVARVAVARAVVKEAARVVVWEAAAREAERAVERAAVGWVESWVVAESTVAAREEAGWAAERAEAAGRMVEAMGTVAREVEERAVEATEVTTGVELVESMVVELVAVARAQEVMAVAETEI